jgi:hypothetical protein
MDKKIAGLVGAVAGLTTIATAQAAIPPAPDPSEGLQTSSYADLLAPIANPVEALQADNAVRARNIELAQYYYNGPAYGYPYQGYYNYGYYRHHHHHHHHHNNYYSRHHHHHHNSAFIGIPGVGGVVVPER